MKYWLVDKDPYFMAYYNPYCNWVVFHPLYKQNNQALGHCSGDFFEEKLEAVEKNQQKCCYIPSSTVLLFILKS